MPRISDEKINEVLNSVDIVDVINQYVPLTKRGRDYKGICPFHQDTKPSLSVSPKLQIYKCFACGAGGNAFTFLQKHLNIDYMEAVRMVADMGGVELPNQEVKTAPKIKEEDKSYYDLHNQAWQIYTHMLHTTSGLEAYAYLQNRHINDEIIEKFGIGYAPNNDTLVGAFERLNYTHQQMALSGLVIEGSYGGYYDRYKNRIMFPIEDEYGHIVGFSGRIYQGEKDQAKYMNSPESPIFNKSHILYHYSKAKEAIKRNGFVYICEGFMDVIALSKIGVENAVALMGTALTSEHLGMIRKVTNHVHVCLDGDNAGKHAALKASKALTAAHFKVSLISLPEGKDPDEILESYGAEGLKEALNKLITPVDFELDYLFQTNNMANYEDRKTFLQEACKVVANLQDTLDVHYYEQRIASLANFNVEDVEEYVRSLKFQESIQPESKIVQAPAVSNKKEYNKYQKAERGLLYYMMTSKQIALIYERKLGIMFDPRNRLIASYIVDYYRVHDEFNLSSFLILMNDSDLIEYIIDIMNLELPPLEGNAGIDDYIETIHQYASLKEIEDLKDQMSRELDPLVKAQLAKRILDMQTKKEE